MPMLRAWLVEADADAKPTATLGACTAPTLSTATALHLPSDDHHVATHGATPGALCGWHAKPDLGRQEQSPS